MRIDGAVFDLDGTLTDSMYIWNEAPKALVRRFGGTPPEDLAEQLKEMGRLEASEYMIKTFRLPCAPQQIMDGVNELVTEAYRERVPAKPGAAALLDRLRQLGVPCGIATASEAFQARDAMVRLGLWDHFLFAFSALQYGSKTGPGLYLAAARTAREAGFLVAGVWDTSAEKDQDGLRQCCHWYLPRLDDPEFLAELERLCSGKKKVEEIENNS